MKDAKYKMSYADFDLDSVLRFYWEHALKPELRDRSIDVSTFVDTGKRRVLYRYCEPATEDSDE